MIPSSETEPLPRDPLAPRVVAVLRVPLAPLVPTVNVVVQVFKAPRDSW